MHIISYTFELQGNRVTDEANSCVLILQPCSPHDTIAGLKSRVCEARYLRHILKPRGSHDIIRVQRFNYKP